MSNNNIPVPVAEPGHLQKAKASRPAKVFGSAGYLPDIYGDDDPYSEFVDEVITLPSGAMVAESDDSLEAWKLRFPDREIFKSGRRGKWLSWCVHCGQAVRVANLTSHELRCTMKLVKEKQGFYCRDCKRDHRDESECVLNSPLMEKAKEQVLRQAKRRNLTHQLYKNALQLALTWQLEEEGRIEMASLEKPFVPEPKIERMMHARKEVNEPIRPERKDRFDGLEIPSQQSLVGIRESYAMFVKGGVLEGTLEPPTRILTVEEAMQIKPPIESQETKVDVAVEDAVDHVTRKSADGGSPLMKKQRLPERVYKIVRLDQKMKKVRDQMRNPNLDVLFKKARDNLLELRCNEFMIFYPSGGRVRATFDSWGAFYGRKNQKCQQVCRIGCQRVPLRNRFDGLPVSPTSNEERGIPSPLCGDDEEDVRTKRKRVPREDWDRLLRESRRRDEEINVAHGFFGKKEMADRNKKIRDTLRNKFKKLGDKIEEFMLKSSESEDADLHEEFEDAPSDRTDADVEDIQSEVFGLSSYWADSLKEMVLELSHEGAATCGSVVEAVAGLQDAVEVLTNIVHGIDPTNPIDSIKRVRRDHQRLEMIFNKIGSTLRTPLVIGSLVGMLVSPFAGLTGLGLGIGSGLIGEWLKRTKRGRRIMEKCTRVMAMSQEVKRLTRAIVWIGIALALAIWSGVTKSGLPLLFGIPAGIIAELNFSHAISGKTSLLTAVLFHICRRFMPRAGYREFEEFTKSCRDLGVDAPLRNTLYDTCQMCVSYLAKGVDFFLSWMNSRSWFKGKLDKSLESIHEFQKDLESGCLFGPQGRIECFFRESDKCKKGLQEFIKDPNKNAVRIAMNAIACVMAEGEEILRILQASGKEMGLQNGIKETLISLKKLREQIVVKMQMTTNRVEPTVIWIAGPAGSGKTTFAQLLMRELVQRKNDLMKKVVKRIDMDAIDPLGKESDQLARVVEEISRGRERKELDQEIWTKSGTDKFWTGYTGQRCVSWEEAAVESVASRHDMKNTPSHQQFLTDFLQLVSQADFRPQMAAVEEKGTQVNPDFVVVTSNVCKVWTSGDQEAIRRRQHIPVLAYKVGNFSKDMKHLKMYVPTRIRCNQFTSEEVMSSLLGFGETDKQVKLDCGLGEMQEIVNEWNCVHCGLMNATEFTRTGVPKCPDCLAFCQRAGYVEQWREITPGALADLAWSMHEARIVLRDQNTGPTDIFGRTLEEGDTPSFAEKYEEVQTRLKTREELSAHGKKTDLNDLSEIRGVGSLLSNFERTGLAVGDLIELPASGVGNNCFFDSFRKATQSPQSARTLRAVAQRFQRSSTYSTQEVNFGHMVPVDMSSAFFFCHEMGYSLSVFVPEMAKWFNDDFEGSNGHIRMCLRGSFDGVGHWTPLVSDASREKQGQLGRMFEEILNEGDMCRDALCAVAYVLEVPILNTKCLVPIKDQIDKKTFRDVLEEVRDDRKHLLNLYLNPVSAPILANLYDLVIRREAIPMYLVRTWDAHEAILSNSNFKKFLGIVGVDEYRYKLRDLEKDKHQVLVLRSALEMTEDELLLHAKCCVDEDGAKTFFGLFALSKGVHNDQGIWEKVERWIHQNKKQLIGGVVTALSTVALAGGIVGMICHLLTKKRNNKERAAHRAETIGLSRTQVINPDIWGIPSEDWKERELKRKTVGVSEGQVEHIPFYETQTKEGLVSWRPGSDAHAFVPGFSRTVFERIIACCGRIRYGGSLGCEMFCTQISGCWFICPAHLVPLIDRGKQEFEFTVEIRGMRFEGIVPRNRIKFPSDLNHIGFADTMLIEIPDMPMGPKISQYIEGDPIRVGDAGVTMSVMPGEPPILALSRLSVVQVGDVLYRTGYELLRYPGFSCGVSTLGPGDCGTLFVKNNKICGMYVAGGMSRSDFVTLDLKTLNRIVGVCSSRAEMSCEISEIGPIIDRCFSQTFSRVPRSELIPSGISDAIIGRHPEQPIKIPAVLSDEAFIKGLRKFSREIYQSFDASRVLEYLKNRSGIPSNLRSIRTWMGAASGRQGAEQISKPVDLSTSAGLPWVDMGLNKKDLITQDEHGWYKPCDQLVTECERYEKRVMEGQVDSALCFAQLKDELRDLERVREKKTRVFIANPLHVNLVFRKYLLPFMSIYKKKRNELYHAIGSDVFSDDWRMLAQKATGRRCFAVDFSRFDASHPRWLIVQCFDFIASFYEQETDRKMIHNLGECLVNFSYYFRGRAYMATGGQPSGSQVTTVLNSIVNAALWLQCWVNLGGNLEEFPHHCDLTTFGDDCILFADRYAQEIMVPSLVQGELAKMGYTITAPDKSDTLEYASLRKTTFLGRSFKPGPGNTWLPHRDEELIWASLCWEHENASDMDTEARIRVALMEFSVHDDWKRLVNELRECCESNEQWQKAWNRVPWTRVVSDFRRRVGLGGVLSDGSFGAKSQKFEKATPGEWSGIPELTFG